VGIANTGEEHLLRQLLALAFIFACTTIAWVILGTTITSRTYGANQQLQSHVASTWGAPQQETPPSAMFTVKETKNSTSREDGRVVVHEEQVERQVPLALQSSRIHVNIHLDPRQKGLLWYSTYAVDFTGLRFSQRHHRTSGCRLPLEIPSGQGDLRCTADDDQ